MEIRIGSLIPVVNEKNNRKLNESSLHRFLLELPFYPTAALADYIVWKEIDAQTARGILTYKGITAEADFFFDQSGNLIRQEALRYHGSDEQAERIPCIAEITAYSSIEGLQIPREATITWMLADGPFTWYKLTIADIQIERY